MSDVDRPSSWYIVVKLGDSRHLALGSGFLCFVCGAIGLVLAGMSSGAGSCELLWSFYGMTRQMDR